MTKTKARKGIKLNWRKNEKTKGYIVPYVDN